ncbi:MAG: hypothetical protein A2287_05995 [Candidatus Melainabacteria bacterium RIFOXYA12_FULL_32_12]|nr:MAG: hypothetical protein A2255_04405 [Candidatus Melainabacteria bacterium RIFOXYA2_FULL_32_9]OGI27369.1 MAG: hypothetical protein A2287_05995 [Candidatus Melainabacteria bacterium RIFOXYA12_FULL_32_12]
MKKLTKRYFSRKAQGYVEYLTVALVVLIVGLVAFPPLFKTASDRIVNSSPKYKDNDVYKYVTLLGPYSSQFVEKYKLLLEDPSAKDCVDEIRAIMVLLGGVDTSTGDKLSDQDIIKIVNMLGDANISGNYTINAASLLSPACKAVPAIDPIEEILTKEVIQINLIEDTCEDVCTVTTTANAILREITPLIDSGTISKDIILIHQDSPVTTISESVEEIFQKYYYVGPDTVNPYTNYKNMINLIEYANKTGQLTNEMKEVYEVVKTDIEKAMEIAVGKPIISETAKYHPDWEAIPGEYVAPVISTSTSSSTTSSSSESVSETPQPPPPPFYFCGPPGELSKFVKKAEKEAAKAEKEAAKVESVPAATETSE